MELTLDHIKIERTLLKHVDIVLTSKSGHKYMSCSIKAITKEIKSVSLFAKYANYVDQNTELYNIIDDTEKKSN